MRERDGNNRLWSSKTERVRRKREGEKKRLAAPVGEGKRGDSRNGVSVIPLFGVEVVEGGRLSRIFLSRRGGKTAIITHGNSKSIFFYFISKGQFASLRHGTHVSNCAADLVFSTLRYIVFSNFAF